MKSELTHMVVLLLWKELGRVRETWCLRWHEVSYCDNVVAAIGF